MAGNNHSIEIGDIFQSEGRSRAIWVVDSIINVPRSGVMVRLAQVDGITKISIPADNLHTAFGFTRLPETSLPK